MGPHHHETHTFVSRWPSDHESRDDSAYNFSRHGGYEAGGARHRPYDVRYMDGIGDFYLYGPRGHGHTHGSGLRPGHEGEQYFHIVL